VIISLENNCKLAKKTMVHTGVFPTKRRIRQSRPVLAIVAVVSLLSFSFPMPATHAAVLTKIKDTLSTQKSNVVANHTINFVTPTGVQSDTDTITIDFTGFTVGSVDYTDIDLAVDGDANCDGSWTDKTLAATATTDVWGAAISTATLTLTPPTNATTGEITAGRCVQVEIGTNAASGNAQFTNPNNQSTLVVELAGGFGDSGTYALDFVAESAVNISAVVDATLSFSISDTTVGFGSLAVGTGRWATGDLAGENASATTPTAAHTMSIATNAQTGWAITYNGATLTSGGNDITVASVDEDSDGTPGNEEFGIAASTNGNSTIATGYLRDSVSDFSFTASTLTTLVSEAVPTNTETISVSYLANIAGTTEAGTYSTDITYVATATF
jgi:hypothetical protein